MEKLLSDLYSGYGKYINQFRSFPHYGDGLKIVERRLLYSLYQMAKNYTKSAKVVGHCIGNYHPHSDDAAYETLVNLVRNNLAIGQGNFGTNIGISSNPPAAMRYTEVKFSKFISDLAFENIDYVPQENLELEEEPVLLPTKLPFCFLGNEFSQGMGFGYRTMIPIYETSDLVKRLEWLLNRRKREPIIYPKTNCNILSSKQEIKNLLEQGNQKLILKGNCYKDINKSVVVTSVPPSRSFSSILKALNKEITQDKSVGFQDESTTSTKVRFVIRRPRMIKQDDLLKKIEKQLEGSITFECNVCGFDGKVKNTSVDDMLLNTYTIYEKVENHVLSTTKEELEKNIAKLKLIEKLKPYISNSLKKTPNDLEAVIFNILQSNVNVSEEALREIFSKFTISRLFNTSTDTSNLEQNLNRVEENINNIKDYIWDEKYENLKK